MWLAVCVLETESSDCNDLGANGCFVGYFPACALLLPVTNVYRADLRM